MRHATGRLVLDSDRDHDLERMLRAATNLRSRGDTEVADRLEAAAERLWRIRVEAP